MADFNFNDLEKMLNEFVQKNETASASLSGYLNIHKQVASSQKKLNAWKNVEAKLDKEINNLQQKGGRNLSNLTNLEKERLNFLNAQLEATKNRYEETRRDTEALKQATKTSNLLLASTRSIGEGMAFAGKKLLEQKGFLLDGLKAVRATEKNMGLLNSQTAGFRDNMYKSSLLSSSLGVDIKDLAQIQSTYSDGLERNVILSQKQLLAVSEISKGTNMSVEAAGAFASKMEMFAKSAIDSRDAVEDITRSSAKMGVNSTKVLGKLETSLKMANKYHFKDGVKGMARMAQNAAKFKIEMESVGGVAEKLFDPEGAIEMAAQLQVLGGGWSQIADPFQLMFKARNDVEGLQKDLIKAASGAAKFNKETGEFEISSLELSRMRSVADATGLSMDELAESAKSVAKQTKIKSQIRGVIDPDLRDFVANSAVLENGKAKITIDGKPVPVEELGQYVGELKKIMSDKSTLKDKADKARTFDESFSNLILKGKSALLPVMEKIDTFLTPLLTKFTNWLDDPKNMQKIVDGIQVVTDKLGVVFDWFSKKAADSPITTAITTLTGALVTGGFAKFLLGRAQWYSNGMALASGFNAAAAMSGAGGLGNAVNNIAGGLGSGGVAGAAPMGRGAKALNMVGGKAGLAGLAGLAMNTAANTGLVDPESGWGKALNIGGKALEYGAMGAMIGGPWGAAIGGTLGAGIGVYDSFFAGKGGEKEHQDFIARPGADPISFSSADTLVGLKKDGGLGKALINGGTNNNGSTVVTFDKPLEIKGKIELTTNNGSIGSIDLNNPIIIRELTKIIQEQLSKNLSGGKISSNPV